MPAESVAVLWRMVALTTRYVCLSILFLLLCAVFYHFPFLSRMQRVWRRQRDGSPQRCCRFLDYLGVLGGWLPAQDDVISVACAETQRNTHLSITAKKKKA